MLRLCLVPLLDPATYRRWLYLVLGGVLFFPLLLAALVLAGLVRTRGVPDDPAGFTTGLVGLSAFAFAAALAAAIALIRGIPLLQLRVARSMLGGELAEQPLPPPETPPARARAAIWLALHFTVGFAAALTTMVVLSEIGVVAFAPLAEQPSPLLLPEAVITGDRSWLGPPLAAGMLLVACYPVALVGAGAARLGALMLGPSAAERLAAARAQTERVTERARIAAELHDSIGHVLSVVTLQAGTAARLIDSDPAFARQALETIAEQTRTAAGELDHVLGLLREERPRAPRRELAHLEELVHSARAAGAEVRLRIGGETGTVPGVVARETYRLAQEGLTNALRHGTSPIEVSLEVEPGRLRLEVANPLPRRLASRRSGGRGLRGLSERVALLGGTLRVGPDAEHWRMSADIPWKEQR